MDTNYTRFNPIENLWSNVKINSYESGKQYNSKEDPREIIKTIMLENEQKLTK